MPINATSSDNPNVLTYDVVPLITESVDVALVNKILDITVVDDKVTACNFKLDKSNMRSNEFNKMIGQKFPPHIPITHRNTNVRELSGFVDGGNGRTGQGRRAKLPQVLVQFNGKCGFHLDGCETTWNAGFDYNAVLTAGSNSAPKVPMLLQINGKCEHPANKERGRCSGSARLLESKEVSNQSMLVVCKHCVSHSTHITLLVWRTAQEDGTECWG